MSERPDDIQNGVPGLQCDQFARAFADGLDDQRDGSRVRIGVGDGQRNSLGAVLEPDDDKLAGLPDPGDTGHGHIQPGDVRTELLSGQDRVHRAAGLATERWRRNNSEATPEWDFQPHSRARG